MRGFCCPVCGAELREQPSRYVCPVGHSFDRAREGYVNLLRSQKSRRARHGDDAAMVRARRDFLQKGYYEPLRRQLCHEVLQWAPEEPFSLLDAGCGEGWYTGEMLRQLHESGHRCQGLGVDVSRDALRYAARRGNQAQWAVASVFSLPVASAACRIITQVFSPLAAAEFHRALSPGGALIRAVPLVGHLWELKAAVYPSPYENKPLREDIDGFCLRRREEICYRIALDEPRDIQNLFLMTPYYYKSGREDQARLKALTRLETRVEFALLTYEKMTEKGGE